MNSVNSVTRTLAWLLVGATCAATAAGASGAGGTPSSRAAVRDRGQPLERELKEAGAELDKVFHSPQKLLDARDRRALASKAVPAMRRMMRLARELGELSPQGREQRYAFDAQFLPLLVLLGDREAEAELAQALGSRDPAEALAARTAKLMLDWYEAHKDPAAQERVVGRARELARAHPAEQVVFRALTSMSRYGPADERMREEVAKVMREELRGPVAQLSAAELVAGERMRSLGGKPLVLEGKELGGGNFSTERWKGKVVLVDFWATWCGPCVAELPRIKEAYAKYHGKGLEVLGVSSDFEAEALRNFLGKHPDMPWPQLFDPGGDGGMHPLAERLGVRQIPTLFLIDRRGVLRSVTARDDLEDLLPKLLEEKAE